MIKYGSYLHKLRVIVSLFSDSYHVQNSYSLPYRFCCQFSAQFNDLCSVGLEKKTKKKDTLKPYFNAFV